MPPPPPGPAGDILSWIIWLIGAGLIIAFIVIIVEYFAKLAQPRSSRETSPDKELGGVMEELLREIRLLRREIEELRKELHE